MEGIGVCALFTDNKELSYFQMVRNDKEYYSLEAKRDQVQFSILLHSKTHS